VRIKELISQHRNDFRAIMECEHCGEKQKLDTGYDDSYYHSHVIPAMACNGCGKDRDGQVPHKGKNDSNT